MPNKSSNLMAAYVGTRQRLQLTRRNRKLRKETTTGAATATATTTTTENMWNRPVLYITSRSLHSVRIC